MEVCYYFRCSARKELAIRQTVPDFPLGGVRFDYVIGGGEGGLEFRGQEFRYGWVGGESTVRLSFWFGAAAKCAR